MNVKTKLKAFAYIGALTLLSTQAASSESHINYNEKPLYFDGEVFSQSEINTLFQASYNRLTNTRNSKVLDVSQIGLDYLSILILEDGKKKVIYTDGEIFFDENNSPTKLINKELTSKLNNAYQINTPSSAPIKSESIIHKALNLAPKQSNIESGTANKHQSKGHTDAMLKVVQDHKESIATVMLTEYQKGSPDLIVFVSHNCGYCKKLIRQFKASPEKYNGINLVFIPVGNPETVQKGNWLEFFGSQTPGLDVNSIIKNNDFFMEATKVNNDNVATPSYIWNSEQKGRVIKLNGLIESSNMHRVISDAKMITSNH